MRARNSQGTRVLMLHSLCPFFRSRPQELGRFGNEVTVWAFASVLANRGVI
jgi:hypothetical protein